MSEGGIWLVMQLKTAIVTPVWPYSTLWVIYGQPSSLLVHMAYGNDCMLGRGIHFGGGEHEHHKGRCGLFLLCLIGQDPLSLTFCTPSLAFHMLIVAKPKKEMCWSWVVEDKDSHSPSLSPFHAISLLFFASSSLKRLDRLWHERKWVLSGWEMVEKAFLLWPTPPVRIKCGAGSPCLCVRGVLFWVALVVCIADR